MSIEQGPGYAEDVYVSLDNGVLATVPSGDWDLAFEVGGPFSIGIRINDGNGRQLAVYPHGDISDWSAVDSTGFHQWPKLNNRIDLWENGAFNVSTGNSPSDFSWGEYTGSPMHQVVGDSIYVIQNSTEAFKLRINVLDNGVWNFTYASLDGSFEEERSLDMGDYVGRNFIYFDLSAGEVRDREPLNTEWDMVFTRYVGPTSYGLFPTTGVLLNRGRFASKAEGVDVSSASHLDHPLTADSINTIGNHWRVLENFAWQLVPELCYFVESGEGNIYKLWFTEFGGSATGLTVFEMEMVSSVSVHERGKTEALLLYPNPSFDGQFRLSGFDQSAAFAELRVFDLSGTLVFQEEFRSQGRELAMDFGFLAKGMYILTVSHREGVELIRFQKH